MKLLILGYSNIIQRRGLPAFQGLVEQIDLASRQPLTNQVIPEKVRGEIFSDYETALKNSTADIVYVSTTNNTHQEWVERSLDYGFHTIVDKPSFLSFEATKKIIEKAKNAGLCLAESTVYPFHPQIKLAKEFFKQKGITPEVLNANFQIPALDASNFRMKKHLGGGALWDMGPYAVSLGRIFFNEAPSNISCQVKMSNDLDTSFKIQMTYPSGHTMTGNFGFNFEYRNQIEVSAKNVSLSIERVFSTPPELNNQIQLIEHEKLTMINVPKADTFTVFLKEVIKSIEDNTFQKWYEILMKDSELLNQTRKSAGL